MSVPADLWGGDRPDRMMRVLHRVALAYRPLTRFFGLRRNRPPAPDRTLRLRIAEIRSEAPDVRSFVLRDPDGLRLPGWQPGCHLDVQLPSGVRRQYSLCGDPADTRSYRIAVRRIVDGGGGSREMHRLAVGERLLVNGPRNAFPFVRQGNYLFIAGGIGITPILPMVRAAHAAEAQYRLVYTGRSRTSMPFLGELAPYHADIRPDDEYGVPGAAELLATAPPEARVICCGPPAMIELIRSAVPTGTPLHWERFSAPPVRGGRPFDVVLARSGTRVHVGAQQTALTAIRAVRPDIGYSCQQGFCGTCKVRVLSGAVNHHDHYLTEEQRTEHMTICVSRAEGELLLDL